MKKVTIGRIVHYYPNGAPTQAGIAAERSGNEFLAALVINVDDNNNATLSVFPADGSANLPEFNVPEKDANKGGDYFVLPTSHLKEQSEEIHQEQLEEQQKYYSSLQPVEKTAATTTDAIGNPEASATEVKETKKAAPKKAAAKK